ncbi:hypothetical protein L210DRAFT_3566323 [Boletus edulis BED1]|uniref:Uncharacterized protein n=1 Tax=Boletus edulis BED1 TaxID=1328754 RepID=A0AAD4BF07_BOLED|nr:hypothetical protein L210DRAFT_3566323 [Boletus edulis BED1]
MELTTVRMLATNNLESPRQHNGNWNEGQWKNAEQPMVRRNRWVFCAMAFIWPCPYTSR